MDGTSDIDSTHAHVKVKIEFVLIAGLTVTPHYLYDAMELPSGSIIACGYNRTYEPEPKDWGWLIKVSKDGWVVYGKRCLCSFVEKKMIHQQEITCPHCSGNDLKKTR
ncbi:MAG: hypothetical protein OHK0019_37390 [Saprospiraceae bacterium]